MDNILRWSVDHPGIQKSLPEVSLDEWKLEVKGLVKNKVELTWVEFTSLNQVESVSDFHCVETWSVKDQKWGGVLFTEIEKLVKPMKDAKYALFESHDGYSTSLKLDDLRKENVLLAHRLNEETLPQPLGGPMRLIVPDKYAYKSPMWLRKIVFSKRDKLGYWEGRAYSNSGNPWRNDRYTIR